MNFFLTESNNILTKMNKLISENKLQWNERKKYLVFIHDDLFVILIICNISLLITFIFLSLFLSFSADRYTAVSERNSIKFYCHCGRSYNTERAIQFHIRVDCGVEPSFACQFCSYKTKRLSSLKIHMKSLKCQRLQS